MKRLFTKKIKSPWYGIVWIMIWTAALIGLVGSGKFTSQECVGLFIVWVIMVGITVYQLVLYVRLPDRARKQDPSRLTVPALNAPCPCGSGKKYKRCCGSAQR